MFRWIFTQKILFLLLKFLQKIQFRILTSFFRPMPPNFAAVSRHIDRESSSSSSSLPVGNKDSWFGLHSRSLRLYAHDKWQLFNNPASQSASQVIQLGNGELFSALVTEVRLFCEQFSGWIKNNSHKKTAARDSRAIGLIRKFYVRNLLAALLMRFFSVIADFIIVQSKFEPSKCQ